MMDNTAQREMTLKEVVSRLPESHRAHRELVEVIEVLEFYGDPRTYFGIRFFPDRPCGALTEDIEDFEGTILLGTKPGKKARALVDKLQKE